ncbi:hypothetical protein D6D06_05260 [Aureobasidium pullulans]|nr:hypothetical protein D6D06_05260 [Aureobasidium pullulans]
MIIESKPSHPRKLDHSSRAAEEGSKAIERMRTESLRDFTVLETVCKDEGRMTVRECDWQGHRMITPIMAEIYTNETPQEVKEAKGLHLLTQSTPNGQKVQIMLEELAAVYGTTWTTTLIDISTNEQKKDWYLRLNPNGRIPTIVDNTKNRPFPVMETSAELLYLVKKFDKDGLFTFDDELEYSQMLQWLFFWHGSGAPYQGQLGFFSRAAEKVPMAIERFRNETLRVFGVLEIQLSGKYSDGPREYLVGAGKGKYSIADIGTWTWTSKWKLGGFREEDMHAQFPHLLKWISRIGERKAVKTGTGSKYAKK